jgi:hypothetical protein
VILQDTQSRLEESSNTQKRLETSLIEKESELVELSDYFESKKLELQQVKEDFETQSEKRQRIFEVVSDREIKLQKDLHSFLQENKQLKVFRFTYLRFLLNHSREVFIIVK